VTDEALRLRGRYAGRVAGLSADEVATAIAQFEAHAATMSRLEDFAFLSVCTDAENPAAKALQSRAQANNAAARGEVGFFALELQALGTDAFKALGQAESLQPYRHYMARLHRQASHVLSEAEERMAAIKDVNGVQAWRKLYNELTASAKVRLDWPGGTQEVTVAEASSLLSDPDRDRRKAASEAMIAPFIHHAPSLTAAFNAIVDDLARMSAQRGYASVLDAQLVEENLDASVLEAMMTAVESRYDLVHRYFRFKARALDITDFAGYDLVAPYDGKSRQVPFEEGRRLVLDAFSRFSPELEHLAESFFSGGYIDPFPANGKWLGAFCIWSRADLHPYILLNYTGQLHDVLTLAHELGHGAHFCLLNETQTQFNVRISAFNETPSTFAEMLTFHRLLETESDPGVRRALLSSRIEAAVSLIFMQVQLTRWEQAVHQKRREGLLSADELCEMWMSGRDRLFGPEVHLPDWNRWGWLRHSQAINQPFYTYLYPFGQLLVYALFQQYKEEGEAFADRYLSMLRSGVSMPVHELLAQVGVDIHDPAFWMRGLDLLEGMIAEFEELGAD
jgi:oligoendopeptidase F